MKIDLEILSTELLKPSTPTPHHLKSLKLSLLDQTASSTFVPVNLFYTQNDSAQHDLNIPGRLKDQVSIDCNDEGVLYKEARVGCKLSEILEKPDIALLAMFSPFKPARVEIKSPSMPFLGVQVNVFRCGGIVIGTCFSHVVAEAKSISTFLMSWPNAARGLTIQDPDFTAASTLFPPIDGLPDHHGMIYPRGAPESSGKFLTKRFLLDENSLGRLKTKVATNTNPNPTRIQAVTALVWERYNYIISKVPLGIDTSNFPYIIHVVNLRPRADPPLPNYSMGNLTGVAVAQHHEEEEEEGSGERKLLLLPELAEKVKKSFDSVDSQFIRYLQSDQQIQMLKKVTAEEEDKSQSQETTSHSAAFITISSWCNMGIYEVDFGWGEPTWFTSASDGKDPDTVIKFPNCIFCDAGPRNGKWMEAWLTLPEEQMAVLENDPQFLQFASLNPSVLS